MSFGPLSRSHSMKMASRCRPATRGCGMICSPGALRYSRAYSYRVNENPKPMSSTTSMRPAMLVAQLPLVNRRVRIFNAREPMQIKKATVFSTNSPEKPVSRQSRLSCMRRLFTWSPARRRCAAVTTLARIAPSVRLCRVQLSRLIACASCQDLLAFRNHGLPSSRMA